VAPTGGVTRPIAREITVIIPKNIGSIPRAWIRGKNIGHNKIILASRSMNIPVTNIILSLGLFLENGLNKKNISNF